MIFKYLPKSLFSFVFIFVLSVPALAQLPVSLKLPRASPFETRSITIGLTTISFEYSSVGIKGREVWGGLVPYDQVWRIGANENTIFEVTDDVLIDGQPLKAGRYAMHSIPGEDSWILIFSTFSEAWGSYFYDESEDALRIEVTPEKMNSTYEWMKFSFEEYTDTSVDMSMKWAGLKVPFRVEVPMEVTFQNIKDQFRTAPAFAWQGWYQGAEYSLNKGYEMETGLQWIDRAIGGNRSVQTLSVKGKLLAETGKTGEAEELAATLTSEFSSEWTAYTNAADIYKRINQTGKAVEALQKALELAPENRKGGIRGEIESLN